MIHFDCDYLSGAHPRVLDALVRTNALRTPGYGLDEYSDRARQLIRDACASPDAQVFFMVGGTQTNATVLDGLLTRTQGVLAAETGHINVHESGAIELSCHKVIALPATEGKITANWVNRYMESFYADDTYPHMVAPGACYISFPTEVGTVYTLQEIIDLSQVCHRHHLYLYVDGARLGYGLAASQDVTLPALAQWADVFYIGGTKMGTLFGEAVVCANRQLLPAFFTLMKAHGAVLAKGRLLGVQFEEMFRDGLYAEIGHHGVEMALRLRRVFEQKGYHPFIDSVTNQQFFTIPNDVIDRLLPHVSFSYWGPRGEQESQVRFVTSWETRPEDIDTLASLLPFYPSLPS